MVDTYSQKPRGKNMCSRSALLFWHLSRSFELSCPQVHTGRVERTQGIGFYRYWGRYLQSTLSKSHFQTLLQEFLNPSLPYGLLQGKPLGICKANLMQPPLSASCLGF